MGKKTCIICGKDGKVLVCEKCPIDIHDSCMRCPARFDGKGKFQCPYCLYRQSLKECWQAKAKLTLVEKDVVSCLLGKEGDDSEQTPNIEELIVKILRSRKRKFDARHKRAKANEGTDPLKKLGDGKQETVLQSTRSSLSREEAEGPMMDKQRDASAVDTFKQSRHDKGTEFASNEAHPEIDVLNRCGDKQENVAEKYASKVLEVETIQLKCSELDDGFRVVADPLDEQPVEQPGNLYQGSQESAKLVVVGVERNGNAFVKEPRQLLTREEKELHFEQTQAESQGSSVYPMRKGRVNEIHHKLEDLNESCLSCPDNRITRRRMGYRKGAQVGRRRDTDLQPVKLSEEECRNLKLVRSYKSRHHQKPSKRVQSTIKQNVTQAATMDS